MAAPVVFIRDDDVSVLDDTFLSVFDSSNVQ